MAEEGKVEAPEKRPQDQGGEPQQSTPDFSALSGLENMIPKDVMSELQEASAPKQEEEGIIQPPKSPEETLEPEAPKEEVEQQAKEEVVEEKVEEPKEKAPKEEDPLDFMMPEKNEEKQPKEIDSSVDLEAIDSLFEEKYGVKAQDALEGYGDLKKKAEDYTEIKAKYDGFVENLNNMPEEIVEAIRLYETGGNYREAFNLRPQSLDYNKNPNDYSDKDLIDTYFPNEMSEEDWESSDKESDLYDERAEKLKNKLAEEARKRFENDKGVISQRQKDYQDQIDQNIKRYNQSLDGAVQTFKKNYPKVGEAYISDVKKALTSDGLQKLFFNEDGTLKEDAAERFMFARDGSSLIQKYQKIAAEKAVTQEREEIVTRSQEQRLKNGQQRAQHSEAFNKKMEELNRLRGSNLY